MEELVKHIERSLRERGFCVVLEDDVERCWPSGKINRADREKDIESFAESHGWIVSIFDADSGGIRAMFKHHSRRASRY